MKILSIDGGGIRGVYSAHILMRIEEQFGKPLNEIFDMVAGTSTGSIISAAAAAGKPMANVLQLYREHGTAIFRRRALFGLFKSPYDSRGLRAMLQSEVGDFPMAYIPFPILITSVDLLNVRTMLLRSYEHPDGPRDMELNLADAVLASCAAPIFFPPHRLPGGTLAMDGGTWANNPALAALTDATRAFGKELAEITLVSVGTGLQPPPYNGRERNWGLARWVRLKPPAVVPIFSDLMLDLASEGAAEQCRTLCGGRFLRVNGTMHRHVAIDDMGFLEDYARSAEETYRAARDPLEALLS